MAFPMRASPLFYNAACFDASDEGGVISRRVNAQGRSRRYRHQDFPARLQGAELFQALELFERRARQGGQLQQKSAAISIEADVLVERRRLAGQESIVPL